MKIIFAILLFAALGMGCVTAPAPSAQSYINHMASTRIPTVEFDSVTAETALETLRVMWKAQEGTELPLAELEDMEENVHPRERTITFHATNVSYYDAIREIATKSGYHISFSYSQAIVMNVWPNERLSFQWKFDEKTKKGLGLAGDLTDQSVQAALEKCGVDFSDDAVSVHVLGETGVVLFTGLTSQIKLAESVLILTGSGYEIKKGTNL